MRRRRRLCRGLFVGCALALMPRMASGQPVGSVGLGDWLTVSANLDGGYRQTQLFLPDHHVGLLQWDARIEMWLPPFQSELAWGPYLRFSGVAAPGGEAWENAWLGRPGVGIQVFPASVGRFRQSRGPAAGILGPLRLFAEHNVVHYWGEKNNWRPDSQNRLGADYWKALHVNSPTHALWVEAWNGVFWQSSNEFTSRYRSTIIGNVLRVGVRKPGDGVMSLLSLYGLGESVRTKNDASYWENHLLVGGGVRVAPSLIRSTGEDHAWFSRLVVYAEYLDTIRYYGAVPEAMVPRSDIRLGISTNLGQWYR